MQSGVKKLKGLQFCVKLPTCIYARVQKISAEKIQKKNKMILITVNPSLPSYLKDNKIIPSLQSCILSTRFDETIVSVNNLYQV